MARITKPVEERRQEIIDTARALFVEHGFDGTQVADISRKINVASGLVYHYFKSKQEILYAVFDQLSDERLEIFHKILKEARGSVLDRLNLIFENKFECKDDFEIYDKLAEGIASDPAIVEHCRAKISTSMIPLLISLIEQGNADGSLHCEHPRETAMFIVQGAAGFMPKIADLSDSERRQNAQAFADIICRVLGAKGY
ncbi:MAG: TetR/AcrR family transcriptional regulator [Peptococcaceae bacterium]|jgi:AcrR family transcriptional regulator|nr:TetR/AcrR family transcriptional regulator [Peptococcaceae bacterium]